ncbi:hypothetical protein BD779DRAFT_1451151 [Infundibulicybe gibba]|nr:hypothetical protein BD779DRAFT_1451151 [Infundibulicybe gibba]
METLIPVPKERPAAKILDYRATNHDSFITHIDRSPVHAKIMAFQKPFWFNMILGGLLIWRAVRSTSRYSSMVFALYGEPIKPSLMSWIWTIINLIIDLFLGILIWPHVHVFITGHLWHRLRWGFRETEIVFRKPIGWRRLLLKDLPPEEFQRRYAQNLYRAIDPKLIFENTGYLTKSDQWVLDYDVAGDAYSSMAVGEVDIKTWDLSVWVRMGGGWHVWEIWRLHDKQFVEVVIGIVTEKLRSMGKEDIIQQWESVMEASEASPPTQLSTVVADIFHRGGVNFAEMWADATKEATTTATSKLI